MADQFFRKKPVVIRAWQYDGCGGNAPEYLKQNTKTPVQFNRHYHDRQDVEEGVSRNSCFITTLEGRMECPEGHWIIEGVEGELYACDPEIFAATYERVEAGT